MADQQVADEDLDVLRRQAKAKDEEAAAAREAAAVATRERDEARARAEEEINNRVAADEAAVTAAIAAQEAEIGNLTVELQAAGEKGDYAAMAAVNRKIASAQYTIERYGESKRQIDNWKRDQLAAAEAARKRAAQPSNRAPTREEVLSRYTPRTRAWLEKHADILDDQRKVNRATSAHFDALAEGLTADTPEYFEFLEGRVYGGGRQGQQEESARSQAAEIEEPEETVRVDRDPGATAAAPSRQTPRSDGTSERRGTVRLTAAEQDIARRSFSHLKTEAEQFRAYAENKVQLQKEGRL
jgi:hypothetical protein